MQLRALAGILGPVADRNGAHLRKRYVLAMIVSILVGLAVSVWLAIDSPNVPPPHPSYLPAD